MQYIILKQISGKPLVKIHKDKDNNVIRDYLALEFKDEIDKVLDEELKAGITFTSEPDPLDSGKINKNSIRMVARTPSDPQFLEGLLEGINLHPVIMVGGFPIQAAIEEE